MKRRSFLRTLLLAVFAPQLLRAQEKNEGALPAAAPVPWTLGLNPKTPLPQTVVAEDIAASTGRFFTSTQMSALTRLSDLLQPAVNGRPGALEAETPQFLDFLIGSSPEPRKKLYTAGLDWLNAESVKKYKVSFERLDQTQAGTIVDPWVRTWISDHPPATGHEAFITIALADIREATVNSEVWNKVPAKDGEQSTMVGLYWAPIDPIVHQGRMMGCEVVAPGSLGAPKGGNALPEYQR